MRNLKVCTCAAILKSNQNKFVLTNWWVFSYHSFLNKLSHYKENFSCKKCFLVFFRSFTETKIKLSEMYRLEWSSKVKLVSVKQQQAKWFKKKWKN